MKDDFIVILFMLYWLYLLISLKSKKFIILTIIFFSKNLALNLFSLIRKKDTKAILQNSIEYKSIYKFI